MSTKFAQLSLAGGDVFLRCPAEPPHVQIQVEAGEYAKVNQWRCPCCSKPLEKAAGHIDEYGGAHNHKDASSSCEACIAYFSRPSASSGSPGGSGGGGEGQGGEPPPACPYGRPADASNPNTTHNVIGSRVLKGVWVCECGAVFRKSSDKNAPRLNNPSANMGMVDASPKEVTVHGWPSKAVYVDGEPLGRSQAVITAPEKHRETQPKDCYSAEARKTGEVALKWVENHASHHFAYVIARIGYFTKSVNNVTTYHVEYGSICYSHDDKNDAQSAFARRAEGYQHSRDALILAHRDQETGKWSVAKYVDSL